jgi:hypothetical protein
LTLLSPETPSIFPERRSVVKALLDRPSSQALLAGTEGQACFLESVSISFHVRGKLQRNRERITVHGLNDNHKKEVTNLFKKCGDLCQHASKSSARLLWGSSGEGDVAITAPATLSRETVANLKFSGSQNSSSAAGRRFLRPLPGPQTKGPSIESRDASPEQPSPSAAHNDHMPRALRCEWLRYRLPWSETAPSRRRNRRKKGWPSSPRRTSHRAESP